MDKLSYESGVLQALQDFGVMKLGANLGPFYSAGKKPEKKDFTPAAAKPAPKKPQGGKGCK